MTGFKGIEPGSYGIEAIDPQTPGAMICGSCGRAWADDITPAGRCPWEIDHAHSDGEDDDEEDSYGWWDFEQGDSTPEDVHYITILNPDGDEIAVIVHRASEQFPIDGDLANEKRKNAQFIVDALNAVARA